MQPVGANEARTHLSNLPREVAQDETEVVTHHSVPIVHITPIDKNRADSAAAMEEIHRFRRERRPTLDGITLRELIAEGRM